MEKTIAGRYRLEERLGAGGMAEVWVAHDLQLDRRVALKLLGPRADRQRFEREARAIASLSHPNICRLFDYGSEGARPYMVFEHLPGGTLEDRFETGEPLDDASTETIAGEIAAGLAHAHDRGIIHRDLKPPNVVFDEEGHAKITDFGIARMSGADTLTEEGTLLGTASYMSPEQASGEPVTPASDVYSFGVILYRMLGGRLPFESPSAVEVLQRPPAPGAAAAVRDSRRSASRARGARRALAREEPGRAAPGRRSAPRPTRRGGGSDPRCCWVRGHSGAAATPFAANQRTADRSDRAADSGRGGRRGGRARNAGRVEPSERHRTANHIDARDNDHAADDRAHGTDDHEHGDRPGSGATSTRRSTAASCSAAAPRAAAPARAAASARATAPARATSASCSTAATRAAAAAASAAAAALVLPARLPALASSLLRDVRA